MVKNNRKLWKYILLSLVTCGIYQFYFIHDLSKDLDIICEGDGQSTPGLAKYILLSLVTCGWYGIYWEYKVANRLAENAPRYNLNFSENGTTVLVWNIFGSLLCFLGPWIALNILITNTNKLATRYLVEHPEMGENPTPYEPKMTPNPSPAAVQSVPAPQIASVQPESVSPAVNLNRKIHVVTGEFAGADIPIQPGEKLCFGRDAESCQLILSNPQISRKHGAIEFNPITGKYRIECYSASGIQLSDGNVLSEAQYIDVQAGVQLILAGGKEILLLG